MRGRRPTPPAAEGAARSGGRGPPHAHGAGSEAPHAHAAGSGVWRGRGPPHARAVGQSKCGIQVWAPRTHAFLCDEYLFS